jgi:hypothetical protein
MSHQYGTWRLCYSQYASEHSPRFSAAYGRVHPVVAAFVTYIGFLNFESNKTKKKVVKP